MADSICVWTQRLPLSHNWYRVSCAEYAGFQYEYDVLKDGTCPICSKTVGLFDLVPHKQYIEFLEYWAKPMKETVDAPNM